MKEKIKKVNIYLLLVLSMILPINISAYSDYIIASGKSVGLEIKNNGVIVADFYSVNNISPGLNAGLKKGDIIRNIDNKNIVSSNDFINVIKNDKDNILNITYYRSNKKFNTSLKLVKDNDVLKTGLYIKDKISGIGTLTFIDPNTKYYGALGHEMFDGDSKLKLEVYDGTIYDSKITSINKSTRGNPGSKRAISYSEEVFGNILENTNKGVFGKYTDNISNNTLYKVSKNNEIKKGNAKIKTVINDKEVKEYDIKIIEIDYEDETKNILFEVIDEELIKSSGGIVQGMSGSPIVQGNNIVGAVNNVVVNDPLKGYGIFITSMLEEAEN